MSDPAHGPSDRRDTPGRGVLDNTLAFDQFVSRCERVGGIFWSLSREDKVTPEFRFELRVFTGAARGIYRGATATHPCSKALAVMDEHKIGWAAVDAAKGTQDGD